MRIEGEYATRRRIYAHTNVMTNAAMDEEVWEWARGSPEEEEVSP